MPPAPSPPITTPTRLAPNPRRSSQTKSKSKDSSSENLHNNNSTGNHDKSISSRSGHTQGLGNKSADAVTGIRYPSNNGSSPHDSAVSTAVDGNNNRHSSSNTYGDGSSGGGGVGGGREFTDEADVMNLDAVWDSIRQKKEKKLAKEKPKVQSLDQVADEMANMQVNHPGQYYQPSIIEEEEVAEMMMKQRSQNQNQQQRPVSAEERNVPKRRKSISSCRESTDGKSIVMVFDMSGVCKEDIHVGFQKSRLMLTWATAELTEWEENGVSMRERSERIYHRTIPLADGTRFEEVHGQMHGSKLVLRFPNMRCIRVEAPPLKRN